MRQLYHNHPSFMAYLSTGLTIVTGSCFAILCALMLLVELVIKVIAVPVIFLFGISTLAYGLIKRIVIQYLRHQLALS